MPFRIALTKEYVPIEGHKVMPTIDLATKIISPNQKIWLVHPGVGRKYYDIFRTQGIAFLAMPGLELTLESCKSSEKIRQHIRMSKTLRKYFHEDGGREKTPSKNPNDYSKDADRDVNSDLGNVQGLYCEAVPGDMIVVTGYGQYQSTLIGEFSEPFNPKDKIVLPKHEYAHVQYRRIRWINTGHAKREYSRALAERLVNRKAVVQLPKDKISEELYQFAYSSYVIGERSKVNLYGPKYKGHNLIETNSSTILIAYLAAAFSSIEKNELEIFVKLDADIAIQKYFNSDLIQDFYQEFHSPGKFVLFTKSAVLAAFLIIGITMLTSTTAAEEFKKELNIENSVDGQVDNHFQEGCEKYKELLKSLSDNGLCMVEDLAKKAKEDIDLKTPARVKTNKK